METHDAELSQPLSTPFSCTGDSCLTCTGPQAGAYGVVCGFNITSGECQLGFFEEAFVYGCADPSCMGEIVPIALCFAWGVVALHSLFLVKRPALAQSFWALFGVWSIVFLLFAAAGIPIAISNAKDGHRTSSNPFDGGIRSAAVVPLLWEGLSGIGLFLSLYYLFSARRQTQTSSRPAHALQTQHRVRFPLWAVLACLMIVLSISHTASDPARTPFPMLRMGEHLAEVCVVQWYSVAVAVLVALTLMAFSPSEFTLESETTVESAGNFVDWMRAYPFPSSVLQSNPHVHAGTFRYSTIIGHMTVVLAAAALVVVDEVNVTVVVSALLLLNLYANRTASKFVHNVVRHSGHRGSHNVDIQPIAISALSPLFNIFSVACIALPVVGRGGVWGVPVNSTDVVVTAIAGAFSLLRFLVQQKALATESPSNNGFDTNAPKPSRVIAAGAHWRRRAKLWAQYLNSWVGQQTLVFGNSITTLIFFLFFYFTKAADTQTDNRRRLLYYTMAPRYVLSMLTWVGIAVSAFAAITSGHALWVHFRPNRKVLPSDDSLRLACILKAGLLVIKALILAVLSEGGHGGQIQAFEAGLILLFCLSLLTVAVFTVYDVRRLWTVAIVTHRQQILHPHAFYTSYAALFVIAKLQSIYLVFVSHLPGAFSASDGAMSPGDLQSLYAALGGSIFTAVYCNNECAKFFRSAPTVRALACSADESTGSGNAEQWEAGGELSGGSGRATAEKGGSDGSEGAQVTAVFAAITSAACIGVWFGTDEAAASTPGVVGGIVLFVLQLVVALCLSVSCTVVAKDGSAVSLRYPGSLADPLI